MTEILEKIERKMLASAEKRAAAPTYIIDPVAFFVALIGGPILLTLMTFWILFIPVFALFFGGPFYLLIGTPVLLWYLRHNLGEAGAIARLAFISNLVIVGVGGLAAAVTGDEGLLTVTLVIAGIGMIFGPAWGWGFGFLYNRLRRDFYARPQFIR